MKGFLLLFSLFLYCLPFSIHAQEQAEATLRIFTSPPDAIIRLDTTKLRHSTEIKLDTGVYTIKAWAPTRELITKEIKLKDGAIKTVALKLPYTKEYKAHKRKHLRSVLTKNSMRFLPIVGYAVFALRINSKMNDLQDEMDVYESNAERYQNLHRNSFWKDDIEANRILFENNKARYNNALDAFRENQLLFQIGTAGAIATTYLGWRLSKKVKKPEFKETPKLSYLRISPVLLNQSTACYISYQF